MLSYDLVVVDGPNLFNSALRSLSGTESNLLARYLRHWLDFDRLLGASHRDEGVPHFGTVFFHSNKQLGSAKTAKLESQDVVEFWARQGSHPFCSTEAVVLPGVQDEVLEGTCPKCSGSVELKEKREKGVDTAITSFLWETSDKWTSVCIVSGDADFVPPARSLKRRGKRVFCMVERGSTKRDLIQVCTSHLDLDLNFLSHDLGAFRVLRKGGTVDQYLAQVRSRYADAEVRPHVGMAMGTGLREFVVEVHFSPMLKAAIGKEKDLATSAMAPDAWSASVTENVTNDPDQVQLTLALGPGKYRYTQNQQVVEGINRHLDLVADSDWAKAGPLTRD